MESEYIRPEEIERRSFEIIRSELNCLLPEDISPVVLRCIHTTADFDYAENLYFSEHVISLAMQLLQQGCTVVTDTNMAKAGISKTALTKLGCEIRCFMADEDIARTAKEQGITRASASVEKAAAYGNSLIYVVGNAPTALMRICELSAEGIFTPALVIGMPVGFVNVVPAKEMLIASGIPCIVARGRKGGSNVAAAVMNALLYQACGEKRA